MTREEFQAKCRDPGVAATHRSFTKTQPTRESNSTQVRRGLKWRRFGLVGLMRQWLQGFFPILLIALMVQIIAPIGATWTAAAVWPQRGI